MNIWKISIQNLKSKPLYTFLSVLVLSLSIALLLGVQQLKTSFKYQMENNLGEIDLVIGAKGSPLQLVLASVLHLDNPTGNISYKEAQKIGKNPMIKFAVPISYGDNYKGFKIVGTTPKFLSLYNAELKEGRTVKKSMEVVLGSSVAEKSNLKIGDTFLSSHGLVENDIHVHEEKLTVVGILKPTKKVIDRLIVTNLESVWDVHHHHHHEEELDGEEKEHGAEHHHHNETKEKKEKHTKHHHKKEESHDAHSHPHPHPHKHHHHKDEVDGKEKEHDTEHHHHETKKKKKKHTKHHHKKEESHDAHSHPHPHPHPHEHHHHKDEINKKNHNEEHKKEENHGHHHEKGHEEKEITSLLISFKSPTALLTMPRRINEKTNMQAALPKYELDRLYEYMGVGFKAISWIAYLILIISGITIFISLYKMVKERAFDLALLRTYGASNFQLIQMVAYEGLIVIFTAFILGFILTKAVLYFIFKIVSTGYQQNILQELPFQEVAQTGMLVLIMAVLSILLAIYPIIKMNISTILSNEKP